jgi:hypothetical protein
MSDRNATHEVEAEWSRITTRLVETHEISEETLREYPGNEQRARNALSELVEMGLLDSVERGWVVDDPLLLDGLAAS